MVNFNKKLVARDGRAVRIYSFEGDGKWPIHGAILCENGKWEQYSWMENGRAYNDEEEFPLDLVNAKEKKIGWIAVYFAPYDESLPTSSSYIYPTEEECRDMCSHADAYAPVEWME